MESKPFPNPGKVLVSFISATIVAVGFGISFLVLAAVVFLIFNKIVGWSNDLSFKAALCSYFACLVIFPYIGQRILFHKVLKRIFGPRESIEFLSLTPVATDGDQAANPFERKNGAEPPAKE